MTSVVDFFSVQNQQYHFLVFTLVFVVCYLIETVVGITKSYDRKKHFLGNAKFIALGALIQSIVGFGFGKALTYENLHQLGLVHVLGINNVWLEIIFIFIFLDFTYWLYHFLMHKINFLWRFHVIHHSDHILNVSTSLREHPVETVIRLSHYVLAVLLLGPQLWIISLHQFVQVISKIIIHGNYRLPEKVDKFISLLILTPNMHHAHHHETVPFTDSNYGDLFSVWDRWFGTYTHMLKEDVKFGIDVEPLATEVVKDMSYSALVKMPFKDVSLSK